MMRSSSCHDTLWVIFVFVLFFWLFSLVFSSKDFQEENATSMTGSKSNKMKLSNARLPNINRPFVKSIKSPDGDIIDCVLFHLQLAFDFPKLKAELEGEILWIPPELPKGLHADEGKNSEIKQIWNLNGESCPNGTIPIRRTTASDIAISKLGKKHRTISIPDAGKHEHAVGFVENGEFFGAKADLNLWKPYVSGHDFSLSQLWLTTNGVSNHPLNTIEAGWHVYPFFNKDSTPRVFAYWTPDGYRSGCYNLLCPGFVQTTRKVTLGGAIATISTYGGPQYELTFMIWKDLKTGNWWLKVQNEVMGYWPISLFTDLRYNASTVEYGGEVSSLNWGKPIRTQMGSGHFPGEGFRKAAYIKDLQVIDYDNNLVPAPELLTAVTNPNCYDLKRGHGILDGWHSYIYFGGPGYNPRCR